VGDRSEVIFALDLATQFGFCVGAMGGKLVSGSIRCAPKGSGSGAVFGGYMKSLTDLIKVHQPRVVAYEAPFAPSVMRGHTSFNTTRVLLGLPAITEAVCDRMGIWSVYEAKVQDVRQHFIGQSRLQREDAKRAVIARCKMLGLEPKDDNEADAIALHDYVASIRNPRLAALRTPLFENGDKA
jgi:crossover junction endodeoxyribonuclease RuvC